MSHPLTLETAKARIAGLAYHFGNADSLAMEAAAKNGANGCAAFWHSASGSNDVVGGFLFYLAQTQDVVRAWEAEEAAFRRPSRMRDEAMLDRLLPLNDAAVRSLALAYRELSTFRTDLFTRTMDADDAALDALRELRATGGDNALIAVMGGLDHGRIAECERAVSDAMFSAFAPEAA